MAIASSRWNPGRVAERLWEVVEQGWYLGFTAFGGPPVHFKIVSFESFLGFFDALLMGTPGKEKVRLESTC
jgi:phosphoketolase